MQYFIEIRVVRQAKKGPTKTLATTGNKSENEMMLKKRRGVVMLRRREKGFTLVELLVVMSIIAVLSAALITQVTNIRETARSMKCKSNLRMLAQAALNYGTDHERMAWAGSHEHVRVRAASGGHRTTVDLRRGWVDWTTSAGSLETWPKDYSSGASYSGKGRMMAAMEDDAGYLSVTNGVLWSYTGRDLSTYVCESHRSKVNEAAKRKVRVYRSYFMNCYFGYNKDYMPLSASGYRDISPNKLSDRGSAASLLLFAEMPISQSGVDAKLAVDGVLETVIVKYNASSNPQRESIGFNHMVGKRYVAHLAYADGHVDLYHLSGNSSDPDVVKKLTGYLCNGVELPAKQTDWVIPPVIPDEFN